MSVDIKDVRSRVNYLIQACKDGQQGFVDAAHHVKDSNLKALFLELSQQRSMFAGELQQEETRLGGDPEKTGTTRGALHRGWIDFQAKITGQSDRAVIKEVERGEEAAVNAYHDAMEAELPGDIRTVVARQFKAVLESHARMRSLEIRNTSGAA
jgi:uncharacterized protein (TIGR02284 family)